jgi:ABC-type lipoprotein export system ATPase subunit
LLGISHLLGSNPSKLSKGQQKMASIAAIVPNSIALLDEPTTWLDEKNKALVYGFITNSRQPMLIATHDKQMMGYCDKIFMVKEGRLLPCSNITANRFFQNGPSS